MHFAVYENSHFQQRKLKVKFERASDRKGQNTTSGDQFATLPLVGPFSRPDRAVVTVVVALSFRNLPITHTTTAACSTDTRC